MNPCNMSTSVQGYPSTKGVTSRPYPLKTKDGRHRAECGNLGRPYTLGAGWFWNQDHDAPDRGCRCGFYASYDPETDFYPELKWGEEFSRVSGSVHFQHLIIVRAACEVSGRVVMGRLGVRAERMKIKGIAIDWSKHVNLSRPALGYYQANHPRLVRAAFPDGSRVIYEDYVGDGASYPYRLGQEDERATRRTVETAEQYGIDYHGSVAELHEAHPKADISALGVDTSEPEFHGVNLQWGKQVSASIAQAAAQVQAYANQLSANRIAVSWGDEVIPLVKEEENLTAFERVMLNKRNRSAPPGSGIDYRA